MPEPLKTKKLSNVIIPAEIHAALSELANEDRPLEALAADLITNGVLMIRDEMERREKEENAK
jgi:hypothetical protein